MFLVNKFGKSQNKTLKSVLIDFYSPDVLSEAKQQLLKDLEKVTAVSFPHVPKHRQGDSRTVRDVDDMFLLLTTLDENVKPMLSALPTYVADGPDTMPSIRLFEGDLSVLLTMLENLESKFNVVTEATAHVAHDVLYVRTKLDLVASSSVQQQPRGPSVGLPQRQSRQLQSDRGDVNKSQSYMTSQLTDQPASSTTKVTSGNSEPVSVSAAVADGANDNSTSRAGSVQPQRVDWSSIISTPVHDNRFNVLRTITDDEQSDTGPFVEQRSARIKRQRQMSAQQRRQQSQAAENNQQQQRSGRRSGAPLMIGKSVTVGSGITAARKLVKKNIFCIDNLSPDYSVEDIRSFISNMGIGVISCFEVKPRRRRNEIVVTNRKAFRVCISADDRERFLDDSKWPDSVAIFDWFFKPAQQTENQQESQPRLSPVDKRPRVDAAATTHNDVTDADASSGTVDSQPPIDPEEDMEQNDNETTILLDSNLVNLHSSDHGY
mgnify:CR=1 FL=1